MLQKTKKILGLLTLRERWQLLGLLLAIILTALFQTLGVGCVLPFMSLVMQPEIAIENKWLNWLYTSFNFTTINSFIVFTGVLMASIIFLGNAISAFTLWLRLKFVWRKNHAISERLLKKYLSQPYIYFLNRHSGDLSKNILAEINLLTGQILMPLMNLLAQSIIILSISLMLMLVNPGITAVTMVVLAGPYALLYLTIRQPLERKGNKRLEANRLRFKAASEAFSGIKELKVMGREQYFLEKYSEPSKTNADLLASTALIGSVPRYGLETVAFCGIILLVLGFVAAERDVRQLIPLVSFYAFAGYRLMPSLQNIFQSFTQIKFTEATLDKIYYDMTDETGSISFASNWSNNLQEPISFNQSISLENITFGYPGAKEPAICNLSLKINYLQSVGIVGPTGAGKTTLVDIILGLITPQDGLMTVDGIFINENNIRKWQRNLGYVPQQIYLCDDTVARNIAFGIPDEEIDLETVKRVASIANLDDFIVNRLPYGYETLIGERGIRLSGGQRQRIGIARALYHDPEVLIFDEATSSLDGVTEDAVLAAINNAAKVKTLIIIAHRLDTIKNCDVIYLLDKGRILTHGTFQELLSSNAKFRAMAKLNKQNPTNKIMRGIP